MQKHLFHILLITLSVFSVIIPISAQLDRFEIAYSPNRNIDAMGFDSLGYPWSLDITKGKLEVIKYNGLQLLKSYFPLRLSGNYGGRVIFIQNKLLIGNETKIYLFDPSNENYETLWELPIDQTYDYSYQDDLGGIWLIVKDKGSKVESLYKYSESQDFKFVCNLPDNLKSLIDNYNFGVNDINGELHFPYEENGILILNEDGDVKDLELSDRRGFDQKLSCSVFRIDNKNGLWRIYEDKIELLNTETKQFEEHPISQMLELQNPCRNLNERLRVKLIFRDSKNRVWIGGENSHLYLYEDDSNQLTFFGKELVDNLGGQAGDVIKLLEDETGNIWGRKRGGVFKITEKKLFFEKYAVNTEDENHSIYKDFPHINRTVEMFGKFGKKATVVACIREDSYGNIYFKDQRFLFKIDAKTKELEVLPPKTLSGKIHFFINDTIKILSIWDNVYTLDNHNKIKDRLYDFKRLEAVFQQKNGTMWYRGYLDNDYNTLFAKIDPANLQYNGEYIDNDGKTLSSRGKVSSITEDQEGNLWVTKMDRIYKIDAIHGLIIPQDTIAMYNGEPIEIKYSPNFQIDPIDGNSLGLKLDDGLAILNTETYHLEEYISFEKIGSNNIDAAHFDEKSVLFSYDDNLSNYNFKSREIVNFSSKDGLDVGDKVWKIDPLSKGRLAVGTYNGLYIFNPDTLISNYKKNIQDIKDIPLRLESYSILESESENINTTNYMIDNIDSPIVLRHNDKMLNLQFSLLNFDDFEDHSYSHWLEGFDNNWSLPVANSKIQYTSLPTGKYNLKVRAHSGNGIWSVNTLNIPIVVYGPWYKRWWAYFIFATLVFGTLFSTYRFQINQILKYQTLRTKISSDLHDDVGTLLSSLAMQSDVLSLDAPPEKIKRFEKFSALSREAMDKMRDTVWAIDSRKDNMVSLIDRMQDYISDMFEDHEINVKFVHETPKIYGKLAPDIRQNVYLIFKEALHNALKYSNGDSINILLKQSSDRLSLSVKDNGTYIKNNSSGLGISNMKLRAKRINGSLMINNNDGFEVLLMIK